MDTQRPNDRRLQQLVRAQSAVAASAVAFGVAVFLGALLLSGCGKADGDRVPVHVAKGAVNFRGHAMPGAFVILHPTEGAKENVPAPRATVALNGSFALSTYEDSDGAPEGEYVVTVQWYKPVKKGADVVGGPNVLPKKYASPHTSNIRIRITAGENQLQPIQLL